ncbi:hypothetical protein [Algoriphagus persicinus]|uniref:hypothetical protein n=1 Tax=Algoriphagus persicinus TaxID=3108754 RepID=UPI002B3A3D57|nr:hypothetical protein [Algoriphagus sp. E1-3-M2]MEB2783849.1 hypothetical protein [Algoriphagus sp. E1-3-M2]
MKGYFGISGTRADRKVALDGASSVDMKNFKEFGLLLSKSVGSNFRLNTGLNYAFGDVSFRPGRCGDPICMQASSLMYVHEAKFKMLSVPLYAEYGFWEFLYAAAGPIVDFQLSDGNNFSDQSGIGYLIGLGGRVETEKMSFSIFPNYKRHSVLPFDDSAMYKHVLQELGLQFGVGYKF